MSGLGDKIRVERLDTARLARIEERVLAARELPGEGMRERRAWLRFAPMAAAACALLVVAGALGYWLRGPGGGAVAGSAPVPAITTGPGESATLAVGDAIVTIGSSSQVSVRARPDGRIDLDLARGKVDCDVTPRPGRPLFAVHAADVDVAVVGTAFSVERAGDRVTVQVQRGKVSVTRAGKQVYLAAGETWPTDTQVAVADPDPDPDPGSGTDPDPDPDPGVQTQNQKTGRGEQGTGNGEQGSQKVHGTTAQLQLPAGPPTASCDVGECMKIVNDDQNNDDAAQSLALYTVVRHYVAKEPTKAVTYANLYLRRFPKGAEAAAVRALKRIAGGE